MIPFPGSATSRNWALMDQFKNIGGGRWAQAVRYEYEKPEPKQRRVRERRHPSLYEIEAARLLRESLPPLPKRAATKRGRKRDRKAT